MTVDESQDQGNPDLGLRKFKPLLLQRPADFKRRIIDTPSPLEIEAPTRQRQITINNRIVRDAELPRRIKELYDYRCQICGVAVETLSGPYAEAAHIRPLGAPHD